MKIPEKNLLELPSRVKVYQGEEIKPEYRGTETVIVYSTRRGLYIDERTAEDELDFTVIFNLTRNYLKDPRKMELVLNEVNLLAIEEGLGFRLTDKEPTEMQLHDLENLVVQPEDEEAA